MRDEPMIISSKESAYPLRQWDAGRSGSPSRLGMTMMAALVAVASACTTTKTTKAPAPQTMPSMERGVASWYGQEFAGRTTANGEIFDPMLFTAAHRTLPFGTIVDVHNPKTNQTVRVRVNDRGPYIGNRVIDLSYAAAQQISIVDPGSGDIEMTVVKMGQGEHEAPAPFSVTIGNDTPAPTGIAAAPSPQPLTPAPVPVPPAVVDRVQVVETHKQPPARTPVPQPVMPAPVTTQKTPSSTTASSTSAASRTAANPAPVPATAVPAPQPVPPARVTPAPTPAPVPPTPAPAPAPASPAPAPSTPPTTPEGHYNVQVGAFAQEANAEQLQDRVTRIGLESHIDHGSLYFVRVGPFATREQAIKVRAKLEAAGISANVTSR
jgi:rare lipoprotein A